MTALPSRHARTGVLPDTLAPFGGPALPPGVSALGLCPERDALVRCPAGDPPAAGDAPAPLLIMLMLHGAGGDARSALAHLAPCPAAAGVVVLAPCSRSGTWDMIEGKWGPDVDAIGQALQAVSARRRVDPARVAIGGFSDGASYALSLGLANGGLFGAVLAFSPGFANPPRSVGTPRVFVSHGAADTVLPITQCSRRIVPRLQAAGCTVRYREFPGGHVVPAALADEALEWAFGTSA